MSENVAPYLTTSKALLILSFTDAELKKNLETKF